VPNGGKEGLGGWGEGGELRVGSVLVPADRPVLGFSREGSSAGLGALLAQ